MSKNYLKKAELELAIANRRAKIAELVLQAGYARANQIDRLDETITGLEKEVEELQKELEAL